jgi:eukaryotic-like serine/threonine-protein kinase
MIGRTIGKYRIVDRLGKGGMGTVFRAVDETLDRDVAVKVLNPELTDSDVMRRFRAEATTLAKLNHPEIATIHEIYRSDSELLMVMELIRGETLDQLSLRSGPLPPERAAYLVAQVLGALDHAHRAGIVHRDLKPANVMVSEHGGIKIMDFGIARVAGAEHLTNDGHMMGTPAYMAPEQVLAKEVDRRADIYSCGVVFYRLLTGKLPFEADTAIGMVQKQLSDAPTPAHQYRADLPDWCQTVLDRALAKSPADRYQSGEEFRSALLTAINHSATEHTIVLAAAHIAGSTPVLGPAVTSAAMAVPVTTAAAATPPAAALPTPTAKRTSPDGGTIVLQKNHFAMAGGLLAVVAIGVAVLAFVAFRRTAPATTPPPASQVADATPVTPADVPVTTPAPPTPEPPVAAAATPAAPAPEPVSKTPAVVAAASSALPPSPAKTEGPNPNPSNLSNPSKSKPLTTPAPSPAAAPVPDTVPVRTEAVNPFLFDAKAVVVDAGKNRERDVVVRMADGQVTVTEKNHALLTTVPYQTLLGVNYSNSKQPLWNSPAGPAEVVKVEGGAFGFLKGGRNWLVLRTKESSVVLRVDDEDLHKVMSAMEERTGVKVERVVERKD